MTSTLPEKTQAHLRALLSIKRRLQQEGICTEAVEAALLALATPASPPDRDTAEGRLEAALTALHGLAVRTGLVDVSVAWDGPVLLTAVGSYLDASGPGGEASPNLVVAARTLLDACVEDFGEPDDRNDEFRDDGAVALSGSGPVAVTFAMIRDLQDALAEVEVTSPSPTTSSEVTP